MRYERMAHLLTALPLLLAVCVPACSSAATPTSPPAPTPTPVPTSTPVPPTPTSVPVLHPGWTTYTNANYVRDMAFDRDGNLWAVGSGGIVEWNPTDGTYTKYITEHGLASHDFSATAVAPDGALWFGTYGDGVSRFDSQTLSLIHI